MLLPQASYLRILLCLCVCVLVNCVCDDVYKECDSKVDCLYNILLCEVNYISWQLIIANSLFCKYLL